MNYDLSVPGYSHAEVERSLRARSRGPVSAVPIPIVATHAADVALIEASRAGRPLSDAAVQAAAPFIARAAQVQVLREMAEDLGVEIARKWDNWTELTRMQERLRDRADQIERGEQ